MRTAAKLDKLLNYLTIILFTSLLLVVVIQIMSRYLPYSAIWTEELSRYLFVYSITAAAPLAIRKNEFIKVDMLLMMLPEKTRRMYECATYAIVAVFGIVLFITGIQFFQLGLEFSSPTIGFQMSYVYISVPILAFLIVLYSILFIIDQFTLPKSEGEQL
ncbi:TRAP transporter small permease [Alkalicoccobacillus plakortidis]|uniref:TRAP transporter small permease n=1 Tax=Alkalicoccobacillus plakortidis TaxID=444060 RepID=A0ABT0XFJ2_9BACI|nr:TRAP transporter small permease [Alkalicoccobacillus plakortidis]MCM2674128.1 TRAP transporter small permease [Alkalicoccobacillus plakortidis]